jgi:hypothetical protein
VTRTYGDTPPAHRYLTGRVTSPPDDDSA